MSENKITPFAVASTQAGFKPKNLIPVIQTNVGLGTEFTLGGDEINGEPEASVHLPVSLKAGQNLSDYKSITNTEKIAVEFKYGAILHKPNRLWAFGGFESIQFSSKQKQTTTQFGAVAERELPNKKTLGLSVTAGKTSSKGSGEELIISTQVEIKRLIQREKS